MAFATGRLRQGRFGLSVNSLRHWEQGSRQPEDPRRVSLRVTQRAPKAVQKTLRAVWFAAACKATGTAYRMLIIKLGIEAAMSATSLDDPVRQRFRRAVSEAYGSRIERVVLFGSCAREKAHSNADDDVAEFI